MSLENFTIRRGVFETNSSSTHNITILTEEDYQKWKTNYLDKNSGKVLTKEDIINIMEGEYVDDGDFEDYRIDNNILSFYEETYLEEDVNEYTSKSGDKIRIICNYGTDN